MVRSDIGLIFTVRRIDEEIKSSVGILKFCQEIRFPFSFLHYVTDAVAAFRNAQVIERSDSGKRIHSEHHIMNETGAIDCVLAVITRIMVAASGIERALPNEREKLSRRAGQARGGLDWVVGITAQSIIRNSIPGERVRGSRHRDGGRRRMTLGVLKAGVRHGGVGAATLMVNAQ